MAIPTQIACSPEYHDCLRRLMPSVQELQQEGYVVAPLTEKDFDAKRRCERCGLRPKRQTRDKNPRKPKEVGTKMEGKKDDFPGDDKTGNGEKSNKQDKGSKKTNDANGDEKKDKKESFVCNFHTGKLMYNTWTCCKQNKLDKPKPKPCSGEHHHQLRTYPDGELQDRWTCYSTPTSEALRSPTPSPAAIHSATPSDTPAAPSSPRRDRRQRKKRTAAVAPDEGQKRLAVAIDCEMGTSADNDSELIRVTLIDYFSGDVLIDRLVWPSVRMLHYNTRYSGVTWQQMHEARRAGACLDGTAEAREQVWRFVGTETIVVGHGTQNDLSSLRWIHHAVVDSFLVEQKIRAAEKAEQERQREAAEKAGEGKDSEEQKGEKKPEEKKEKRAEGGLSLKALTQRRLGRVIQAGKKGHDSLEDAVAARDLVDWHVQKAMGGL